MSLRGHVSAALRKSGKWMSVYDIEFDVRQRIGKFPSRNAILRALIVLLDDGEIEIEKRYVGRRVYLRFRAKGGS